MGKGDAPIIESGVGSSEVESWRTPLANQQKDIDDLKDLLAEAQKTSNELKSGLDRNERTLEANQDLIFYGFIVLVVMVAGMLVDATRGKEALYIHLMERIDSLAGTTTPQTYRLEIGGTK